MKRWTVLVYMAADNDLAKIAGDTLDAMAKARFTDASVLVQLDVPNKKTERYLFPGDGTRVSQGTLATNVNSGDPQVLTDFVNWGTDTVPSTYTALVVWNHGGGWEDIQVDFGALSRPRPVVPSLAKRASVAAGSLGDKQHLDDLIALDQGSRDYLSDDGFRSAIENTNVRSVDLLGCDACEMNMLEIAFEMRNVTSFLVGSERNEPGSGWPFDKVLDVLAEPALSPDRFAAAIVDAYGKNYVNDSVTQSAIVSGNVPALADAFDAFGAALVAALPKWRTEITTWRNNLRRLDNPSYVDIDEMIASSDLVNVNDDAVLAASDKIATVLGNAIRANVALGNFSGACGMSIWFPPAPLRLLGAYKNLQFGANNRWAQFLAAYLGPLGEDAFRDDIARLRRLRNNAV
jgi:hypothetical protein